MELLQRLKYVLDTTDQYYLDEKLTSLKQVGENKFKMNFLSPKSRQRWYDYDLGLSCSKCNTILNQQQHNEGLFSSVSLMNGTLTYLSPCVWQDSIYQHFQIGRCV